jgi:hypothetical protein
MTSHKEPIWYCELKKENFFFHKSIKNVTTGELVYWLICNNFSEDLVQLNIDKTILCISHDSNTYDKKKLLNQSKEQNTFDLK